jgi:hypothetical protein
MERLAQYIIIRSPFSVDKMQPNSSGDSIIYRSGMNPKIQRNFEVFSPCDFIASKKWRELIKKVWEADPFVPAGPRGVKSRKPHHIFHHFSDGPKVGMVYDRGGGRAFHC